MLIKLEKTLKAEYELLKKVRTGVITSYKSDSVRETKPEREKPVMVNLQCLVRRLWK
jgi:hypothetical protein